MSEDLVLVLTTSSVPEGEVARALLEEEGVPVLVKGGGDGPYRMGPVQLFVPAGLEVQARLILAETFADPEPERDAEGRDAAVDEDRERSTDPGSG